MLYNETTGIFELEPEERRHPDDDSYLTLHYINGDYIQVELSEKECAAKQFSTPPPEPTLQERVEQLEKENEMLGDAIIEVAQLALGGTT